MRPWEFTPSAAPRSATRSTGSLGQPLRGRQHGRVGRLEAGALREGVPRIIVRHARRARGDVAAWLFLPRGAAPVWTARRGLSSHMPNIRPTADHADRGLYVRKPLEFSTLGPRSRADSASAGLSTSASAIGSHPTAGPDTDIRTWVNVRLSIRQPSAVRTKLSS